MSKNEGRSKIGVSTLARRCRIKPHSVYECLEVLEKHNFIQKFSEAGKKNAYMIMEMPVAPTESKTKQKEVFKKKETEPTTVKSETAETAIFTTGMSGHTNRIIEEALTAIKELYEKNEWNAKDMGKFYRCYYVVCFDGLRPQDKIMMKEMGMLKRMIVEYGWQVVMGAIEYALDNWRELDYVSGYPSIAAIYGFRNTIIPESQKGANKKGAVRGQHTSKGKEGVGVW